MVKLKLQYFGHLMRRVDLLKKSLKSRTCKLVRIKFEKVRAILAKDWAMLAFIHNRKLREKEVEIDY